MEYALDKNNKLVNADNVDYGIYYCPECMKPCGLRKPFLSINHFFHIRIDPNCSLCYKDDQEYLNSVKSKAIFEECNNAIEVLIKNTTEENWFEAIDCLYEYQQLSRLKGCSFALKPLAAFLNTMPIAYECIDKRVKIENFFIETALSIIDPETNDNNHFNKILNQYNINNKHLEFLLKLKNIDSINKIEINRMHVGNNNEAYILFKSLIWMLKKEIQIADFQRFDRIELSFADYYVIYKYIKLSNKFEDAVWNEFKTICLHNHSSLDLGLMKFNDYIRDIQ
jgi:hypothetical protein